MEKRSTSFITLLRMIISCAVLGIFFVQNSLVASAHERVMHSQSYGSSINAMQTVNCYSASSEAGKHSGSNIIHSDCCQFCQSTTYDQDFGSILKFAKLVAILLPPATVAIPVTWLGLSDASYEYSGFKTSWSSQAPPKA